MLALAEVLGATSTTAIEFDDVAAGKEILSSLGRQQAGVGIRKENLTRIISHGFTTKKTGHGFGLHSCTNTAKEMGGALIVDSRGPGQGATFTLDLPLVAKELAV